MDLLQEAKNEKFSAIKSISNDGELKILNSFYQNDYY